MVNARVKETQQAKKRKSKKWSELALLLKMVKQEEYYKK